MRAGFELRVKIVRRLWRFCGPMYVFLWVLQGLVGAVLPVRILLIRVHDIERLTGRAEDSPEGYQLSVTEADRVEARSFDDTAIRTGTFLRAALERGDKLVAAYENDRIVSYGWCASGPTPISKDLEIRFDPAYIYGYRAHTSRRHRGKGLHTAVIRHAAATLAATASKGMVAYVDASNDRSLVSEARAGDLQTGVVIAWMGKELKYWASPLCRRVGFSLVRRC